jgi:membrane-associated phospholipid phosphatase
VEAAVLQNRSQPPRWIGPILFDGAIEEAFRARTQTAHGAMEGASWVIWFALVGYPLAVDVPHAWISYGRDVAWDLLWQDATALSLAGAVDFALRDSVARLRPSNTHCLDQGGTNCLQLSGPEATRSFPSGHLSETTTGTALICMQHLTMHLYGEPWDGVTCASAIAADSAVAVLKLVADDHWATDIVAGAALGVAFGWGLPVLMHLHGQAEGHPYGVSSGTLVAPMPMVYDHGGGLGAAGFF